jgi:HEAT repeat protein
MSKELKATIHLFFLLIPVAGSLFFVHFFGLFSPALSAETITEPQLIDRALAIIARQRGDLAVRSDLYSTPHSFSSFRRWMEHPTEAPLELQQRAMAILEASENPPMWLQQVAEIGDLGSVDTTPLLHRGREHFPAPQELREAVYRLLDAIYTANLELAEATEAVSPADVALLEDYLYPSSCSGKNETATENDVNRSDKLREAIRIAGTFDRRGIISAGIALTRALTEAREILTRTDKWQKNVNSFSFMTELGRVEIGGLSPDVHDEEATLIIDLGGDDLYRGKIASGTDGKVSLVLDLAGDDTYLGESCTQAAGIWGIGILYDLRGNDLYKAGNLSQGAGLFGLGLLLDGEGSDSYLGEEFVQAASSWGWGGLIDLAGEDTYRCRHSGQAYSGTLGVSALCDLQGNDKYVSGAGTPDPREPDMNRSFSQGFAVGIRNLAAGGIAILADRSGNDLYQCQYFGQGASYWMGVGLLYDERGKDTYIARRYAQGAGIHFSFGSLLDADGNDHTFSWGVSQGCGHDYGTGILIDERGDDTHISDWLSLGVSNASGVGIFVDNAGNDGYETASGRAVGFFSTTRRAGGIGLFMDAGGRDRYSEKGSDNSVWTVDRRGLGVDEESGGVSGINIYSPEGKSVPSETAEQRRKKENAKLSELLARAKTMNHPESTELLLHVASHWGFDKDNPKKAQKILLSMDPEKSVPVMISQLDTPSTTRLIFMKRFFIIHAFHATPELIKRTGSGDPVRKERAFYYLSLLEDTRGADACISGMQDPSWTVRSGAGRALGNLLNKSRLRGLELMRDALNRSVRESDPDSIKMYLNENGNFAKVLSLLSHAMPLDYYTYERYSNGRPDDENEELAEEFSVLVFDHLDAALPLLEIWIDDLSRTDRRAKELMSHLQDSDPAVRRAATYSLGQIQYYPAVAELLLLLDDPDPWVSDEAVASLALFANQVPGPLKQAMKRGSPAFRIIALDLLSRIKSEQSRSVIENHLGDSDQNVRRAAREALASF